MPEENPAATKLRSPQLRRLLLPALVLAVAAGLRCLHLAELAQTPLGGLAIGPDASEYDAWARRILGGELLWTKLQIHAPLYPCLLAGLYWLGDAGIMFARAGQLFLELLAMLLVYAGLARLDGRRTAGFAICFWATCLPLIYHCAEIASEVLTVLFLSAAFCCWAFACTATRPGARLALLAGAGLACGLAAVAHPLALPAGLCGALAAALHTGCRRQPRAALLAAAVFLAGLAAPILPVAWRNHAVSGELVPIQARSGMNFYLGNNPEADGTCYLRPGPEYDRLAGWPRREGVTGERAAAGFYRARAFDFIRSQPAAWLKLLGRKLLLTWNRTELPSGPDLPEVRLATPLMRRPLTTFGTLIPLAFCGFWHCRRRRAWLLPAAVLLAYTVSLSLFVTSARYRLGMLPFLIAFAGAGLDWLWGLAADALRRPRQPGWLKAQGPGLLAATALLAAGWGIAALPVAPLPRPGPAARGGGEAGMMLAEAAWRRGDRRGAEKTLTALLAAEPENAKAWHLRGVIFAELGLAAEARKNYTMARKLAPDNAEIRVDQALATAAAGAVEDALAEMRAVLEEHPADAKVLYNLGVLLERQGEEAAAAGCYRQALAADPGFASAHLNSAVLAHRRGDLERAAGHYAAARRLAPRNERVWTGLAVLAAGQGRTKAADKAFRRALELNPEQPAVRLAYADFLEETWRNQEAAEQRRLAGAGPRK